MTTTLLHQSGPGLPISPEFGVLVLAVGGLVFTIIALDIVRNYELPPH